MNSGYINSKGLPLFSFFENLYSFDFNGPLLPGANSRFEKRRRGLDEILLIVEG